MEKTNLKHKVEQWKLGVSMKNMKEFRFYGKKKSLESLETKDSLFSINYNLQKGPMGFFLGEKFLANDNPRAQVISYSSLPRFFP